MSLGLYNDGFKPFNQLCKRLYNPQLLTKRHDSYDPAHKGYNDYDTFKNKNGVEINENSSGTVRFLQGQRRFRLPPKQDLQKPGVTANAYRRFFSSLLMQHSQEPFSEAIKTIFIRNTGRHHNELSYKSNAIHLANGHTTHKGQRENDRFKLETQTKAGTVKTGPDQFTRFTHRQLTRTNKADNRKLALSWNTRQTHGQSLPVYDGGVFVEDSQQRFVLLQPHHANVSAVKNPLSYLNVPSEADGTSKITLKPNSPFTLHPRFYS
jgi:hypothetical protein